MKLLSRLNEHALTVGDVTDACTAEWWPAIGWPAGGTGGRRACLRGHLLRCGIMAHCFSSSVGEPVSRVTLTSEVIQSSRHLDLHPPAGRRSQVSAGSWIKGIVCVLSLRRGVAHCCPAAGRLSSPPRASYTCLHNKRASQLTCELGQELS